MRWPIHPAPVVGETLFSWLSRIAEEYDLSLHDLILIHLGWKFKIDDLIINPPDQFIRLVSQKTGYDFPIVKAMTLSGLFPWAVDDKEFIDADFSLYVNQFPILLSDGIHQYQPRGWHPWVIEYPLNRACPECVQESPVMYLAWKLPFTMTCHKHSCLLLPCWAPNDHFCFIQDYLKQVEPPSKELVQMDKHTWEALCTNKVSLPNRKISAGIWFRILRRIIHEIAIPPGRCSKKEGELIFKVWDASGLPLRAGIKIWQPFELFSYEVQYKYLIGAASACDLLAAKKIQGCGAYSDLFVAPMYEKTYEGQKEYNPMRDGIRNFNKILEIAKTDHQTAIDLFLSMPFRNYDDETIEIYREAFIYDGIPSKFMSYIDTAIAFYRA